MSLKVTGSIKIDVQGTGTDKSITNIGRDFQVTELSAPYPKSIVRIPITTTVATTINLKPITTVTLCHIRASSALKIIFNNGGAGLRTCTTAHFFVQKAGITDLRLAKNSVAVTADILLIGK